MNNGILSQGFLRSLHVLILGTHRIRFYRGLLPLDIHDHLADSSSNDMQTSKLQHLGPDSESVLERRTDDSLD